MPNLLPDRIPLPRVPIGTGRSDSSLAAAGGYCPEAQFWWYLEWPKPIQDHTLRHVKARHDPSLVSLNSLEYATQLITMLGCHLHHLESKDSWDDPHLVYFECDNTAGKSWLTKGCTSSTTGRGLARLQATLLLDQGVSYCFDRVDMNLNVIADRISHIPSESSLNHEFLLLLTQAPSLLGCRSFLPNAAFISSIVAVLLQTGCMDHLTASRQLLTDPGRFISSPGARRRPPRPVHSRTTSARPQLVCCLLSGRDDPWLHNHWRAHTTCNATRVHQTSCVPAHRPRTAQSAPG
jgi:hypothetical protein